MELCPLRWQFLLVMAPGRTGQDTCVSRLLWKEAVALKVCPESQSPELWSWAPTHGLADLLNLEQSSQTYNFGISTGFPTPIYGATSGKYLTTQLQFSHL